MAFVHNSLISKEHIIECVLQDHLLFTLYKQCTYTIYYTRSYDYIINSERVLNMKYIAIYFQNIHYLNNIKHCVLNYISIIFEYIINRYLSKIFYNKYEYFMDDIYLFSFKYKFLTICICFFFFFFNYPYEFLNTVQTRREDMIYAVNVVLKINIDNKSRKGIFKKNSLCR